MNNEEKLFDLLGKIYSELQETKVELKETRADVKKIDIKIDNVVMPKINALFDGYKANSEALTKIEKEVSKHEEVILRRVK